MENGEWTKGLSGKEIRLAAAQLIALIGVILLVSAYILPCFVATEEGLEDLVESIDRSELFYENYGMTYANMAEISLLEFLKYAIGLGGSNMGLSDLDLVLFFILFLFVPAVFTFLTLAATVLKKPSLMILFDILSFGSFWMITDTTSNTSFFGAHYEAGIAVELYPVGAAAVFIGAIALCIFRRSWRDRFRDFVEGPDEETDES